MVRRLIQAVPLLVALTLAPAAAPAEPVEDRVLLRLQEARQRGGFAELRRRPDLDAVARDRATRIAALPHSERLALDESIDVGLREAGVKFFRSASLHVDMVRGYEDPAAGFLRSWTRYRQAWEKVLAPGLDSVGIATHTADDDWVVLVAVFLDEVRMPTDLGQLERQMIQAINEVRRKHGLRALRANDALAAVAREHSEDMAARDYFSHRSPEGRQAADRARLAGIAFQQLAENIQRNRGHDDPVGIAVESWMRSKGHRENILGDEFLETGVGVCLDMDGAIFFTQLFLTP